MLEPPKDGAAKVERKGSGVFLVRFAGRAAHAGLEPERGASALAEMARFALSLEGLADSQKETTITPSQARGGRGRGSGVRRADGRRARLDP